MPPKQQQHPTTTQEEEKKKLRGEKKLVRSFHGKSISQLDFS
jgi:hypothetical protein